MKADFNFRNKYQKKKSAYGLLSPPEDIKEMGIDSWGLFVGGGEVNYYQ